MEGAYNVGECDSFLSVQGDVFLVDSMEGVGTFHMFLGEVGWVGAYALA